MHRFESSTGNSISLVSDADWVSIIPKFSLIDTRPLDGMGDVCRKHGLKLLTYGTLVRKSFQHRFWHQLDWCNVIIHLVWGIPLRWVARKARARTLLRPLDTLAKEGIAQVSHCVFHSVNPITSIWIWSWKLGEIGISSKTCLQFYVRSAIVTAIWA